MTPIVLAVHFPAKQLSKLRMAAMRLGAKVRVVEKWEYLNAVGALTGDLSSFETFYEKTTTPVPGVAPVQGLFGLFVMGNAYPRASSGSTYSPFTCTSRCRCGPVTQPVAPERPMIWPCRTLSPSETRRSLRWL